jgi:hypothetical protein
MHIFGTRSLTFVTYFICFVDCFDKDTLARGDILKPGEKVPLWTNRVTFYGPSLNATSIPVVLNHFVNIFHLCLTHQLNGSVVAHSAFDGADPLLTLGKALLTSFLQCKCKWMPDKVWVKLGMMG